MPAAVADNHNVVVGSGTVVGSDIVHPNGNIYDQVLLTGPSVTVIADPGQVVRTSFVDDNDDIVQVEFSGTGSVTITIDGQTYQPPAPPAKYNQPGVNYVKGHATVYVQNAAADTNIAIFSVGRGNAVNQALFPAGMNYDGMADIQLLRVDGAQLSAIYAGNVRFGSDSEATGIQAPSSAVIHRVTLGDINARQVAVPLLRISQTSTLDLDSGAIRIAGGRLIQSNNAPIDISSATGNPFTRLSVVDGGLSSGDIVPAGSISARFTSLIPGQVSVNGTNYSTRALLPASFDDALAESGLNSLDFGDISLSFSGGNNGTFSESVSDYIEGEFVTVTITGTYSYVISGPYSNVMTFGLTLSHVAVNAVSGSWSGTPQQLAQLSGQPVPTKVTAVVQLDSSVSGTGSVTITYTSGPSDYFSGPFDLDHPLNFGIF